MSAVFQAIKRDFSLLKSWRGCTGGDVPLVPRVATLSRVSTTSSHRLKIEMSTRYLNNSSFGYVGSDYGCVKGVVFNRGYKATNMTICVRVYRSSMFYR